MDSIVRVRCQHSYEESIDFEHGVIEAFKDNSLKVSVMLSPQDAMRLSLALQSWAIMNYNK